MKSIVLHDDRCSVLDTHADFRGAIEQADLGELVRLRGRYGVACRTAVAKAPPVLFRLVVPMPGHPPR